jgi:hypothetical protein
MNMKNKSILEVEPKDGGNFKVFLDGLHIANLIGQYIGQGGEISWRVFPLSLTHKPSRKHHENPEDAIKSYYGRKAKVRGFWRSYTYRRQEVKS